MSSCQKAYDLNYFLIADVHFKKSNVSRLNVAFAWIMQELHKHKARRVIFLGDTFDHRNTIDIEVQNVAFHWIRQILNCEWKPVVHFLVGNHDMVYLDRRDITSVQVFADDHISFGSERRVFIHPDLESLQLDGFDFIMAPFHDNQSVIADFLAQSDVLEHAGETVIFGHLAVDGTTIFGSSNKSMRKCTGSGLTMSHLSIFQRTFMGHFHIHKSYCNDKVLYVGSPIQSDFGESGDTKKGFVIYYPTRNTWELKSNPSANYFKCWDWQSYLKMSDDQVQEEGAGCAVQIRLDEKDAMTTDNGAIHVAVKRLSDCGVTQHKVLRMYNTSSILNKSETNCKTSDRSQNQAVLPTIETLLSDYLVLKANMTDAEAEEKKAFLLPILAKSEVNAKHHQEHVFHATLLSLEITNFLGVGHTKKLLFPPSTSHQLYIIEGANGAGKSTILDAISWVLFGKTLRNATADKVKRDKTTITVVEAEFANSFRFVRSRSSNSKEQLVIHKPNGEKEIRSSAKETSKKLEELIGIDYDSFIRTCVIDSNSLSAVFGGSENLNRTKFGKDQLFVEQILSLPLQYVYNECFAQYKTRIAELNEIQTSHVQTKTNLDVHCAKEAELREALTQSKIKATESLHLLDVLLQELGASRDKEDQSRIIVEKLEGEIQDCVSLRHTLQTKVKDLLSFQHKAAQKEHVITDLVENEKEFEQMQLDIKDIENLLQQRIFRYNINYAVAHDSMIEDLDDAEKSLQKKTDDKHASVITRLVLEKNKESLMRDLQLLQRQIEDVTTEITPSNLEELESKLVELDKEKEKQIAISHNLTQQLQYQKEFNQLQGLNDHILQQKNNLMALQLQRDSVKQQLKTAVKNNEMYQRNMEKQTNLIQKLKADESALIIQQKGHHTLKIQNTLYEKEINASDAKLKLLYQNLDDLRQTFRKDNDDLQVDGIDTIDELYRILDEFFEQWTLLQDHATVHQLKLTCQTIKRKDHAQRNIRKVEDKIAAANLHHASLPNPDPRTAQVSLNSLNYSNEVNDDIGDDDEKGELMDQFHPPTYNALAQSVSTNRKELHALQKEAEALIQTKSLEILDVNTKEINFEEINLEKCLTKLENEIELVQKDLFRNESMYAYRQEKFSFEEQSNMYDALNMEEIEVWIFETENALQKVKTEIVLKQDALQSMQRAFHTTKEKQQELDTKMQLYLNQKQELETQIAQSLAQEQSVEEDINLWQKKVAQLKDKQSIDECEKQYQTLKSKLAVSLTKLEHLKSLKTEFTEHNMEIDMIENTLPDLEIQLNELQPRLIQLSAELDSAKALHATAIQKLQSLLEEKVELSSNAALAQTAVDANSKNFLMVQNQIQAHQSQLIEIAHQCDIKQSETQIAKYWVEQLAANQEGNFRQFCVDEPLQVVNRLVSQNLFRLTEGLSFTGGVSTLDCSINSRFQLVPNLNGLEMSQRSSGEQRRSQLAAFLTFFMMHRAQSHFKCNFVFFDEILDSLDSQGRTAMQTLLQEEAERLGVSMFLITHLLNDFINTIPEQNIIRVKKTFEGSQYSICNFT